MFVGQTTSYGCVIFFLSNLSMGGVSSVSDCFVVSVLQLYLGPVMRKRYTIYTINKKRELGLLGSHTKSRLHESQLTLTVC